MFFISSKKIKSILVKYLPVAGSTLHNTPEHENAHVPVHFNTTHLTLTLHTNHL